MPTQLTAHYENDNLESLDEDLKRYLDQQYFNLLPYRYIANPKLLVVFSGGNAVGKSTLSRKIQTTCKGLVLENDAIKEHIIKVKPEFSRRDANRTTWQYSMYLYAHLEKFTTNGLIVRDGVIDWYYDRILPIFIMNGYELFIVGYELTYEQSVALIKSRGDTKTVTEERLYPLIEEHALHISRFRSVHTPDIILNHKNLFNHELVITKLQERLQSLKVK